MSRTIALALTVIGVGGLYFSDQQSALLVALPAGLAALVGIWLVSGRPRQVWAAIAVIAWAGALWLIDLDGPSALLFGAAGLLAALIILVKGKDWPGFGSRYQRSAGPAAGVEPTAKDLWESLDRGEDPTSGGSSRGDEPGSG